MKNKGLTIFLIVLFSIVSILLIVFMCLIIKRGFKGFSLSYNRVSDNLYISEEYEYDFKNITIDVLAADVYIKESDTFKLVVYSDSDIKVNIDNTSLVITEKTISHFNKTKSQIEVYVPSDYEGKINIDSNLGKIDIASFVNANIDIDIDCGDVHVVEADNINVDSNLGNITIDKANIVDIKEDCGNVNVGSVRDVSVVNDLGNITIDNVSNYMNIEADCGNVKIKEASINKNSFIQNDLGNITIDKINEVYIDASTDLGKVKVNNHHNSDITLSIHNDCGNITVNN